MGRVARKAKTRLENLIAWLLAAAFLVLVVAGAWFLATMLGVL